MKTLLPSLFLLFVLLFGCLQQNTPPANVAPSSTVYAKFAVPEFTLEYPPDLSFEEKAFFTAPKEDGNDSFQELFTVKTWDTRETLDDLEVYEKGYIGDNANFTNISRTTFKGRDAALLEGDFPPSNKSKGEHFTTIFFKQERRTFRLRYTIEKGKEATYAPFVERMKDSFRTAPDAPFPAAEGYLKYNSSYFSIDYPSKWALEKPDSFRFVSDKENSSDTVLEELLVEISETNKTFDELEQEEKELLWENETISSIQRAQFKGYNASFIEYDGALYPGSVEQQHFKTILFRKGSKLYRLQYVFENLESKKQKFAPMFEKILESFEAK